MPQREDMDMRRAIVLVLVLAAGCGETTFDASSEASAKASMDRMMAPLSPTDKQRFLRGTLRSSLAAVKSKGRPSQAPSLAGASKSLHGLTATQIMQLGDAVGVKASESPPATGPRE